MYKTLKNPMLYFLLLLSVFIPMITQIITSNNISWFVFSISLIMGIFYSLGWVLFLDKNIWGIYFYIIGILINIFLDYINSVYGDLLLRALYMFPIQFIVLKNWKKQLNENGTISYHKWNKKEIIINISLFIIIVLLISYNLKLINKIPILNLLFQKNDPYIILDAMGVVGNIFGQYHLSKEHINWFFLNAVADGALTTLWFLVFITTLRVDALVLSLANLSYVIIVIYQFYKERKIENVITHKEITITEE